MVEITIEGELNQVRRELDEVQDKFKSLSRPFQTISQIIKDIEKDFGQMDYALGHVEEVLPGEDPKKLQSAVLNLSLYNVLHKMEWVQEDIERETEVERKLLTLKRVLIDKILANKQRLNDLISRYEQIKALPEKAEV